MNKLVKMKKIVSIVLGLLVSSFLFTACEEDEKTVFTDHLEADDFAPYVKIVVSTPVIDATQLETAGFSGALSTPVNNVDSWSVSVRRTSNGVTSAYFPLTTVTDFPSEFSVTGTDIAAALGIPVTDIVPGDNIEFSGTSTGTDGSTLTFGQLGPNITGQAEQRQAYEFGAFVACPFIAADIAGTYNVTQHRFQAFFDEQPATREVVSGPGENEFTIIGGALPLEGGEDLVISVDQTTGIVSGTSSPNNTHFAGFIYGNVSGFAFSCVGFIDLTITSPGLIDNLFTLEKQ